MENRISKRSVIVVVGILLVVVTLALLPGSRERVIAAQHEDRPTSPVGASLDEPAELERELEVRAVVGSTELAVPQKRDAGATLRGRVLESPRFDATGPRTLGREALVVLWPRRGGEPSLEDLLGTSESGRELFFAETDLEGWFAFEGLSASEEYDLIAGAPGHGTLVPLTHLSPRDGAEITVLVDRLFGAIVRLEEHSDSSMRLSDLGDSDFSGFWSKDLDSASAAGSDFRVWFLAGVPSELLKDDRTCVVALFHSKTAGSWVGPNSYHLDAPGFREIEVEFNARWLAEGIEEVSLVLEPTSPGVGEVEIRLAGIEPELLLQSSSMNTRFVLHLEGEGARRDGFPFRIDPLGIGLVHGVPAGTYAWSLEVQDGHVQFSPSAETAPLAVRVGEREVLSVPASSIGAVELDMLFSEPLPAGARVRIALAESARVVDASGKIRLENVSLLDRTEPPFAVPLVSEGNYSVFVHLVGADSADLGKSSVIPLVVERGAVTHTEVAFLR